MTERDHLPADIAVQQLVPEGSKEVQLLPETPVLCVHRGRNPRDEDGRLIRLVGRTRPEDEVRQEGVAYVGDVQDTYNSKHYIIGPGHFVTQYGAAMHFKNRAVVPGSRNPETNFQASFISVIGIHTATALGLEVLKPIDDREAWAAFTDQECAEYSVAGEALDRRGMVNPIDREVTFVATSAALAGTTPSRVKSAGGSRGVVTGSGKRKTQIETTDPSVFEPLDPEQHEGIQTMRQDAREAAQTRGRGKDATT